MSARMDICLSQMYMYDARKESGCVYKPVQSPITQARTHTHMHVHMETSDMRAFNALICDRANARYIMICVADTGTHLPS